MYVVHRCTCGQNTLAHKVERVLEEDTHYRPLASAPVGITHAKQYISKNIKAMMSHAYNLSAHESGKVRSQV